MSMEAGVVLDINNMPLHWHLPPGRSVGGLPDSRDLWEVVWENRDNISGIAHSHPGSGIPAPSPTDVTTFAAFEAALGRRLDWWIISEGDASVVLVRWVGPGKHAYGPMPIRVSYPTWIPKLRELSQNSNVEGGSQ